MLAKFIENIPINGASHFVGLGRKVERKYISYIQSAAIQ